MVRAGGGANVVRGQRRSTHGGRLTLTATSRALPHAAIWARCAVCKENDWPGPVRLRAKRGLGIFRSTVYNVSMTGRPLQEPTFLLLTALAKGPQHGYGIMTDVERISGGRVKLRAGTLYAALDRVVAEGLVEADREEVVGRPAAPLLPAHPARRRPARRRSRAAAPKRGRRREAAQTAAPGDRGPAMTTAGGLEGGYQRLLRCYPPSYRAGTRRKSSAC